MENEAVALPCSAKLSFDTKKQALAQATTNGWRYGTKLKAYRCRHCQLWHLATNYTGKEAD